MPGQNPEQPKNHAANQSFMAAVSGTIVDRLRTPVGKITSIVAGTAVLSLAIAGISRGMENDELATIEVYDPVNTNSEDYEVPNPDITEPDNTESDATQNPNGDEGNGEAPNTETPGLTEEPSPSSDPTTSAAPQPTPPLAFEGKANNEGDFYNCWVTENDTAKIFTNEGRTPEGFKLALFTLEEVDGEHQPYIYFPEDNGLVWLNEGADRLSYSAILVEDDVAEGPNPTYPQLDDQYSLYMQENPALFNQLYGSYRNEPAGFYSVGSIPGYCPPKEDF